MPGVIRSRWAWVVLILLIALYVAFFAALSIRQHDAFLTHAADLGYFDQALWNTRHGRFVAESTPQGLSWRLTDHFEPIFALVSLSLFLWDDVRTLLIVQTLALALGAVPVFLLARHKLRNDAVALAFAAAYLLCPAMQAANLTEFHAVPLAVAPLLFAFYFSEREQWGRMWVFALLAITVKEEISLLTLMLGLYLIVFRRQWRMGVALAGLSLAWFWMATFVIIPSSSQRLRPQSEASIYFERYSEFGGGPGEIVANLIRRPGQTLATLLSPPRLGYVGGLLASVGFLALLSPETLLLGAPIFAANLLSNYPLMYSGEAHYSAPAVPFLFIAAIYGTERLARWLERLRRSPLSRSRERGSGGEGLGFSPSRDRERGSGGEGLGFSPSRDRERGSRGESLAILAAVWLLVWAVGYGRVRGFTPWSVGFRWPQVTAHHRLFSRFAAQIPPGAPLSTTPPLYPHLSHRQRIYQFPVVADAEYVLLDVAGGTDMNPVDFRQRYRALVDGGGFGVVDAADGYILLQRGRSGADLPDAFYDFARVADPRPQYPVVLDYGRSLRFLGFDVVDERPGIGLHAPPQTRVRLYWQALEPVDDDLRLYPLFFDEGRRIIEDTTLRPMVVPLWYPPSRWRPGEVVRVETLPWELGDEFGLGLGVVAGDDWSDFLARLRITVVESERPVPLFDFWSWASLGFFRREGDELRLVESGAEGGPSYPMQLTFGRDIAFLGYDLEAGSWKLEAGARNPSLSVAEGTEYTIRLTLYWQALHIMGYDYTVFLHLVNAEGVTVAQRDAQPESNGPRPTSTWAAGETVLDEHRLDIPPDTPPGVYRLEMGLYYWETLERLPVRDAEGQIVGDKVVLGEVRVEK